jgi:uncharacterized protein YndB with AHSA1/START domain
MKEGQTKPVGLTASVGYNIGVRRTLPISVDLAWELLTSPEGVKLWLGSVTALAWQKGETYASSEGTTGEMRVVKPKEQLRLTWKRKGWDAPSTLQIRIIPGSGPSKTTISFHQENLLNGLIREEMKELWESVLAELLKRADVQE